MLLRSTGIARVYQVVMGNTPDANRAAGRPAGYDEGAAGSNGNRTQRRLIPMLQWADLRVATGRYSQW